jgi:hypothetical protein
MQIAALTITLCDPLNPGFGYQMKVEREDGVTSANGGDR